MKRKILTAVLSSAILLPVVCEAQMVAKPRTWNRHDVLDYRTELLTVPIIFVHRVPNKKTPTSYRTCVYARNTGTKNGGRFQRPEQLWSKKVKIGKQIANWNIKAADGSMAHAGVTYDATDASGAKKVLRVEVKQFKEFPNWVFYRYSGVVPDYMSFACPALRPQVLTKHPRSVWIAWDGGQAECGDKDKVPWFGRKHAMIDAYAVFNRGGDKDPGDCDMAVWIPEQYTQIWPQRFKKNDDRFTFYFQQKKGEYTFALGARNTESGEKVNAPAFLKKERHEVAKKLRSIDWTIKVDLPAIRKKFDEVKKMAGNSPAAKELVKIQADIKSGDPIRAYAADNKLDQMKKSLSSKKLGDLFN